MRIAVLSTTKLPKFLGENRANEESLFFLHDSPRAADLLADAVLQIYS